MKNFVVFLLTTGLAVYGTVWARADKYGECKCVSLTNQGALIPFH